VGIGRVYVEAPIYDAFVAQANALLDRFTLGTADSFDVHMGSLTNERELLRVEAHLADALAKGARLLRGGARRPDLGPLFFEPTVLLDVDHTMVVMREETFGPVVPIMRVADAEEAVRLANDTPYGLSASIFTRDLAKGEHLARQLRTGDVAVNRTAAAVIGAITLPWGGEKLSGVGRRGGPEGLLRFVTTQSIVVDRRWDRLPGLSHTDPMTLAGIEVMRRVRRVIPFI
jgi:acyl-CoA reductase-like NAD-dependent aldehyde dehydrogenase